MYKSFEKIINYSFKDKKLLKEASIHSSYSNEYKLNISNQRLEFLGDAVLELSISSYIYNKFKGNTEGYLTKYRASLVCESTLAKLARSISLGNLLKLSKGEEQNGGRSRDSILYDAMEALIGAIFLDSGFLIASNFVIDLYKRHMDIDSGFTEKDSKTLLQEYLQKDNQDAPFYKIVSAQGPDHEKEFVTEVFHMSKFLAKGTGKSKKEAEQDAASNALKILNR